MSVTRAAAAAVLGLVLGSLCVLGLLAEPAVAEPALPPGFQDEVVFPNLEQPTNFRFAPDGRVFVAEKPGKILVFDGLEDTTPEVFADLRTDVYETGDRGLLGLALDPKFDQGRPYVYALYTYDHILGDPEPPPKWGQPETTGDPCPDLNGGDACLVSGRLVRLTASGDHAEESGGEPVQDVLAEDWCQQFSSHSIGDLQFGPGRRPLRERRRRGELHLGRLRPARQRTEPLWRPARAERHRAQPAGNRRRLAAGPGSGQARRQDPPRRSRQRAGCGGQPALRQRNEHGTAAENEGRWSPRASATPSASPSTPNRANCSPTTSAHPRSRSSTASRLRRRPLQLRLALLRGPRSASSSSGRSA